MLHHVISGFFFFPPCSLMLMEWDNLSEPGSVRIVLGLLPCAPGWFSPGYLDTKVGSRPGWLGRRTEESNMALGSAFAGLGNTPGWKSHVSYLVGEQVRAKKGPVQSTALICSQICAPLPGLRDFLRVVWVEPVQPRFMPQLLGTVQVILSYALDKSLGSFSIKIRDGSFVKVCGSGP